MIERRLLLERLGRAASALFAAALLLFALWPWIVPRKRARTFVFYGFSILGDAMNGGIFPAFQELWQRETGERVEFTGSFAGSGTITNQIALGSPADAAIVALEPDADRLAAAGMTPAGSWHSLPFRGIVNRTPLVILVRPGNPKGIHDFGDLAKPGVRIVHPDPLTSGGANWAILAEYGAGVRRDPLLRSAGHDLLLGIWRNVIAQASSARAARTQFENGFGDALVADEQEAVWDRSRGLLKSEVVYPRSTILSEHTLVLISNNSTARRRELAEAFARFLWSETAQRIFVRYGFRSVLENLNDNPAFGAIADPIRIEDLGGWKNATREILEGVWRDRVLTEIPR
ncbi:MAG: substrate-binding domain-containing protein [Thermoanaerobaculia bacterium]